MTTGAMRTRPFSPSLPISTSYWLSLSPKATRIARTCLQIVSCHNSVLVLLNTVISKDKWINSFTILAPFAEVLNYWFVANFLKYLPVYRKRCSIWLECHNVVWNSVLSEIKTTPIISYLQYIWEVFVLLLNIYSLHAVVFCFRLVLIERGGVCVDHSLGHHLPRARGIQKSHGGKWKF